MLQVKGLERYTPANSSFAAAHATQSFPTANERDKEEADVGTGTSKLTAP
jgi:hypothetical protein